MTIERGPLGADASNEKTDTPAQGPTAGRKRSASEVMRDYRIRRYLYNKEKYQNGTVTR